MRIDPYWEDKRTMVEKGQMDLPGPWAINREKPKKLSMAAQAAMNIIAPPIHPYFNDPVGFITAPVSKGGLGEWIWSKQEDICESVCNNRHTAVKAGHGLGKALRLDEPLPTPTGWVLNGAVRVGDLLLDESGAPTRITALSPVQERPSFRITFSDGTAVDCSDEHQWNVLDLRRRRLRGRDGTPDWRQHWDDSTTMTAQQLFEAGTRTGKQLRWRIPVCKPLQLPEAVLPVDPYTLGAWLGDGHSASAMITVHPDDHEILDRISAQGENVKRLECGKYAWSLAGTPTDGRARLSARLDGLGIYGSGKKRIPMSYLRASEAQRRELLRGFMDTDGFNLDGSGVGMDLCNEKLANDVAELGRSLGYKCNVREGKAAFDGTRWRMSWYPEQNPFGLKRKADAWQPTGAQASRNTQRTITSIEPIDTVPMRCLTVDSPRSLFLCGRNFIPTHNSRIATMLIAWWVSTRPRDKVWVAWSAPTQDQVAIIIGRELQDLFERHPELDLELDGNMVLKEKSTKRKLGMGRKPADHNEHGFQGQHAVYLLAILDEAGGIVNQMWRAMETIVTNDTSRMLVIGNPDDPISDFKRKFDPNADGTDNGWSKIKIGVYDSPNFTGEFVPSEYVKQALTGQTWVDERRAEWGEGSPFWVSKILAEFPEVTADTLITPAMIAQANSPETLRKLASAQMPQAIGVDVATYGTDYTVAYLNVGGKLKMVHHVANSSTARTAYHTEELLKAHPNADGVIDSVGVGAGVYDVVGYRMQDRAIIGFNASHKAYNPEKFINRRAEVYWYARTLFETGKIYIPPEDTVLANELMQIRYEYLGGGKLKIEAKDKYRERVGKSPDHADAAVMSLLSPEMKEFFLKDAMEKYGDVRQNPRYEPQGSRDEDPLFEPEDGQRDFTSELLRRVM